MCQRKGALWVRQCCMLSQRWQAAGRETGTSSHADAGRDSELREGDSRFAHLAGLYHIAALGGEPLTSYKDVASCFCHHKTKMQQQLSVAFSPT